MFVTSVFADNAERSDPKCFISVYLKHDPILLRVSFLSRQCSAVVDLLVFVINAISTLRKTQKKGFREQKQTGEEPYLL